MYALLLARVRLLACRRRFVLLALSMLLCVRSSLWSTLSSTRGSLDLFFFLETFLFIIVRSPHKPLLLLVLIRSTTTTAAAATIRLSNALFDASQTIIHFGGRNGQGRRKANDVAVRGLGQDAVGHHF